MKTTYSKLGAPKTKDSIAPNRRMRGKYGLLCSATLLIHMGMAASNFAGNPTGYDPHPCNSLHPKTGAFIACKDLNGQVGPSSIIALSDDQGTVHPIFGSSCGKAPGTMVDCGEKHNPPSGE